jgi:hypothetical protein
MNVCDLDKIIERLRRQVSFGNIRVTLHGHEEMVEDGLTYEEICEAILNGKVIENYPEHQRGACCLVCGQAPSERYIHIVCTTSLDVMIIITVYEPKLPKWVTPFRRRKRV